MAYSFAVSAYLDRIDRLLKDGTEASLLDTFWGGYAGYFQDPDQHLWEVVWNPHWAVQT